MLIIIVNNVNTVNNDLLIIYLFLLSEFLTKSPITDFFLKLTWKNGEKTDGRFIGINSYLVIC